MTIINFIQDFSIAISELPEAAWVLLGALIGIKGSKTIAKIQTKGETERHRLDLEDREKQRLAEYEAQMKKELYLDCIHSLSAANEYLAALHVKLEKGEGHSSQFASLSKLRMIAGEELILALDEYGATYLDQLNILMPIGLRRGAALTDNKLAQEYLDLNRNKLNLAFAKSQEVFQTEPGNTHRFEAIQLEINFLTEQVKQYDEELTATRSAYLKADLIAGRASVAATLAIAPIFNQILFVMRKEMFQNDDMTAERFKELQDLSLADSARKGEAMFQMLDDLIKQDEAGEDPA